MSGLSSQRIPSLDGLRAIAIGMVILGHTYPVDLGIGDYARLGVQVFFVISGFLITTLMTSEIERTGSVDLKRFWLRRALRLFPAFYVFLATVFLLSRAGIITVAPIDFLHAATYTMNYAENPSWEVGHTWSLSVEEQFYLLWPPILAVFGRRRATIVAMATVALPPVFRLGVWHFLGDTPYRNLETFPVVADSLAVGCLLALARTRLEQLEPYRRYLLSTPMAVALTMLVLVLNRYAPYSIVWVIGTTFANLALALLVHRVIRCSVGLASSLLNWGPMVFVGTLSYSIYLWQQLFLGRGTLLAGSFVGTRLALALTLAWMSYQFIEAPLLSLRSRLRN